MKYKYLILLIMFGFLLDSNSQNISGNSEFKIVDIHIDSTGLFQWKVANEPEDLVFYIQQYRWNKWFTIDSIKADSAHYYSSKIQLHSGRNKFRIKTSLLTSDDIDYEGNNIAGFGSCGIQKYSKEISLTEIADYEIYDQYGNIVLKGRADLINISKLQRGVYYLNSQNSMSEFLKK